MVTPSAFGGPGWQPRTKSMAEEIGSLWYPCGVINEWSDLKAVMVHAPGNELFGISNPDAVQMLSAIDASLAERQHLEMVKSFKKCGVDVFYVNPSGDLLPNQMFVADLFLMTPEGAVIARPASAVRSGEERWVARRLADMGIPILGSIHGYGTFEGADAAWLDSKNLLVGVGFRTNNEGFAQLSALLRTINIEVLQVPLPKGIMHLMGMLRIVDRNLCLLRSDGCTADTRKILKKFGFETVFVPNSKEVKETMALNVVTIRPREILMPANNPMTLGLFEKHGISCHMVDVSEMIKAAGAVGCLTGVISRSLV